VLIFSFSLPAARVAVPVFGGWAAGVGRAVLAAGLAGMVLRLRRVPPPCRSDLGGLVAVAAGVAVGFPVLSGLALEHVPASRGAVVLGLLPLVTSLLAALRHGERPSARFWAAASGGSIAVLVFSSVTGAGGRPEPADGLLLLAVVAAAVGYAEGAALTARIGGWQTISWALVLAVPVTVPLTVVAVRAHGMVDPDPMAVAGLAYVSVFSTFTGFVVWYAGLSRGGVARVSQLQLAQPVLTLVWSVLFLGESVGASAVITAVVVLLFVLAARRSPVRRIDPPSPTHPRRATMCSPGREAGEGSPVRTAGWSRSSRSVQPGGERRPWAGSDAG
jgi:drug/metabolite transporter (DMT)-like permease